MKKKLNQMIPYSIAILSLVALLTIFLNSYLLDDGKSILRGFEIAFGKELLNLTIFGAPLSNVWIRFNIFAILSYLLPLASFLLICFYQEKYLLPTLLLILAGILFIVVPETGIIEWSVPMFGTETKNIQITRELGNIIGMVASFSGGLLGLYLNFNKK